MSSWVTHDVLIRFLKSITLQTYEYYFFAPTIQAIACFCNILRFCYQIMRFFLLFLSNGILEQMQAMLLCQFDWFPYNNTPLATVYAPCVIFHRTFKQVYFESQSFMNVEVNNYMFHSFKGFLYCATCALTQFIMLTCRIQAWTTTYQGLCQNFPFQGERRFH
jgi:hypothetical protein